MSSLRIAVVLSLLAVAIPLVFSFPQLGISHDRPRKLKIGFAVPLSGDIAWFGTNTKDGADFYLQDVPGAKDRLEIVVEDVTSNSTSRGVSAVRKLIDVDKVDALVVEMSPVANASRGFIDKARIPTVAITGADCAIDTEFMVKLWLPAESEAAVFARHLQAGKFRRASIVSSEQDSRLAVRDAFKKAQPDSITIVSDEVIAPGDDSSVLAPRVLSANPEIVILNLLTGQNALIAKRLRSSGYRGEFVATILVASGGEKEAAAGALDGVPYVDVAVSPDFAARYLKQTGRSLQPVTANGYDALGLFDSAFKDSENKIDPAALNTALRRKAHTGALGAYSFSFDNRNTFLLPAELKRLE
jgi:ABC-type branched-subunit amino acid transport system substrate-binding protein